MSLSAESSRPLLLPQNRRLRHLQGVYLRNLSFARPRGRTFDDFDVNKESPNKLQSLKDSSQLHHAASSDNLRPRPAQAKRRRSTNLANQSPVTRQKQLELSIESRAADVFFSLHAAGEESPIYISEVKERSTNFNFNFFDLTQAAPSISRSSELIIRVWAKRHEDWTFLLEQIVDLRRLNFIGTLQNQHFPPNCLVFHLIDGVYALELPGQTIEPKHGVELATSSYNALMKLSNLDASIQDALATRDSITAQINEILERTPSDEVPQAEEKVKLGQKYVAAQQRAVKAARSRRDELKLSIAVRRAAIVEGRAAQQRAAGDVDHASSNLATSQAAVASTKEQIRGQRRRICEDLSRIFPISPSGQALSFDICGLHLPNTDYDPTSTTSTEEVISAALGHVAQLAHLLELYLGVPLPYPVTPFGSRSSIRDEISQIPEAQRTFPLFLRGGSTAQYRFDYGWFLLNKDIEALCAASGLKVVDIRHTLPNLKYLLYVCSAGTEELPERKRGGVRGLWVGRMKGRLGSIDDGPTSGAAGSRRSSADSEAIVKQGEHLRKALSASANGHGTPPTSSRDRSSSTSSDAIGSGLPFDESAKLTLRTKGMRENVVR